MIDEDRMPSGFGLSPKSRLYLILNISNESMSLIVVEPPLSWLAADLPLLFTKEPFGFFSSLVKSQNLFLLTLLKEAFGL